MPRRRKRRWRGCCSCLARARYRRVRRCRWERCAYLTSRSSGGHGEGAGVVLGRVAFHSGQDHGLVGVKEDLRDGVCGPDWRRGLLEGKSVRCCISGDRPFFASIAKQARLALAPELATQATWVLGLMAAVTGNSPRVEAGWPAMVSLQGSVASMVIMVTVFDLALTATMVLPSTLRADWLKSASGTAVWFWHRRCHSCLCRL